MSEIRPVDKTFTDRTVNNKKKPGFEKNDQDKNPDLNKEENKIEDRKEEGKGDFVDVEA